MNRKYIFRQDLAVLLELSVRTIKNNEKRWGIDAYRKDANGRVIRYERAPVIALLEKLKVI